MQHLSGQTIAFFLRQLAVSPAHEILANVRKPF